MEQRIKHNRANECGRMLSWNYVIDFDEKTDVMHADQLGTL